LDFNSDLKAWSENNAFRTGNVTGSDAVSVFSAMVGEGEGAVTGVELELLTGPVVQPGPLKVNALIKIRASDCASFLIIHPILTSLTHLGCSSCFVHSNGCSHRSL
jgi:hypothetical protein